MENRKRDIQIKFYVTKGEKEIIENNFKRSGQSMMSGYLRKVCIETIFVNVDYQGIREYSIELSKIGTNINQIAKRVNTTGNIYGEDIEEIKNKLNDIWEQQRDIVSKLRCF